MNIDTKSMAYAFIANGVHIYFSDDEKFLVSKLVCSDCGDSWYMNLTECFLCGSINPFLYRCSKCNTFQSITKSGNNCSKCGSTELYMVCPNPDCLSNTDNTVFKEAKKYGGVFNKNSGLLIAQQFCLSCGSKYHVYKNYEIYIRVVEKDVIDFKELDLNPRNLSDDSYLIVKYKPDRKTLKYRLYKIKELAHEEIKLDNLVDNFGQIVSELYPTEL